MRNNAHLYEEILEFNFMNAPYNIEYNRTCPTCNNSFVSNHLNRRYCSAKCKNFKNNSKSRLIRQETIDVVTILQKNRHILNSFTNNSLVLVEQLMGLGFNFSYHTHHQKQLDGSSIVCIYDYGYVFTQSKTEVKILKLT